jgi:hypothetical protein
VSGRLAPLMDGKPTFEEIALDAAKLGLGTLRRQTGLRKPSEGELCPSQIAQTRRACDRRLEHQPTESTGFLGVSARIRRAARKGLCLGCNRLERQADASTDSSY